MNGNTSPWNYLDVTEADFFLNHRYESLLDVHHFLNDVVAFGWVPGLNIVVAKEGQIVYQGSYGKVGVGETFKKPNSIKTVYDLASLTKVIATWPALMKLIADGEIRLDACVNDYLSETTHNEVGQVTIKQLVTHTAGLQAETYLKQYGTKTSAILAGILNDSLQYRPGKKVVYSNRGFIILAIIIERVSGMRIDHFVKENIWSQLDMNSTFFRPLEHVPLNTIAPTEYLKEANAYRHGEVHDENALLLKEITGHADAFSTINDLAKFSAMVMATGEYQGKRVLDDTLVSRSLQIQTGKRANPRGYAWDYFNHPGFPHPSIGHLGFTGTSMLINPHLNAFVILLTNRIHPSRSNTHIRSIRDYVHHKVWQGLV
ncbi:CubicO group peptidase (beta-lactamase class C family) [Alkalihalobacillus xiaoxiensis]|uniref:CubicO group peptidase (Beta-lactamase class C family) n=1 Tax=Shouchella xiaoxiensis TaxID=766895 RepID=A0ABS2SPU6_9BACI|nr:serine hydrolase [Shouchella xiaoxiensis]MBM7837026.1 CubicO group peptidase (beta-lactamase class C family) [Shouchella xiaoxiensis]